MLNKYLPIVKNVALSRLMVENNDYRTTVFLAGTGRSGTTWIANIINYKNAYRLMFEPFHSQKVGLVRHFRYRQYIRPENREKKFMRPAKAILSGKVRNTWVDILNRKLYVSRRLVKDIRSNHFLKWIKTNFPEIPIILLLRHPCAVAYSKLKLGWETHLDEFLAQDELVADYLDPFRSEIESAKTTYEKHIFMWCIENYVPLKQFSDGEIHLTFYENFCMHPEREVERLFSFLNENYTEDVFDTINLPSAFTRKGSAIRVGESLIESWKKHLSHHQVRRGMEILSIFGLQNFYSDDALPLVNGDEKVIMNF